MTAKSTGISAGVTSPSSLLITIRDLVQEGGGQRLVMLEGRRFMLSLTPAGPEATFSKLDATDAGATQEAELLRIGDESQRAILAHPDMLDLNAASALSGIPVRTLTHMRTANRLLALARAGARRGFRFPAFQFEPTVFAAMPNVLAAFGPTRAWQAFDFLTHTEPLLSGAVPIDLLREGRPAEVERVVKVAGTLAHGAY